MNKIDVKICNQNTSFPLYIIINISCSLIQRKKNTYHVLINFFISKNLKLTTTTNKKTLQKKHQQGGYASNPQEQCPKSCSYMKKQMLA